MMNSVMTGSIKNPLQRSKVGDNLKTSNVSINLKIVYKIKKKKRKEGEEMHYEDVYLNNNCIKSQEYNFFSWTISLYCSYKNFHEKSEV